MLPVYTLKTGSSKRPSEVSPSYDGVLLLGCILGIILLEPASGTFSRGWNANLRFSGFRRLGCGG